MKLRKALPTLLLVATFTVPGGATFAESAEEKGLAISREAKVRDEGWGDMQARMHMILRNSDGQESHREASIKSLEVANDGDKSLNVFDSPRDVKGTAFLSFSHPLAADDQWLYLPALKRVKRIASRNKSGPFLGSEFAYEDLSSFEVEKYSYNYLRDEACEGGTCYVIEQYPVDEDSGYTRRVVWIDHDEYRFWKADFYDRKNALLKTLSYHDYRQYKDKHWRPDLMKMINHQTHKTTDIQWTDYRFDTGLQDSDFNRNALKHSR